MNYAKIIRDVILHYEISPIDILGIGDTSEYQYLTNQAPAYVRTVRDLDQLWDEPTRDRSILELGSFLGPVSISLKKMGYNVSALDIPEFHKSESLRALYAANDIPFAGVNLRKYQLPYKSDSLDAVVMCEVLEHLNFNPLPLLQEINRVLKNGGYLYIAMPNQAHFFNRIRLLRGRSVHNSIQDYFSQVDRHDNMIVGLHWREYTMAETVSMIEKMGFTKSFAYYFGEAGNSRASIVRSFIEKLVYLIPSCRPQQIVVGRKSSDAKYDFWLTEANS